MSSSVYKFSSINFLDNYKNSCFLDSIVLLLSKIFYENKISLCGYYNEDKENSLLTSFLYFINNYLLKDEPEIIYRKNFLNECNKHNLYNKEQDDILVFLEDFISKLEEENKDNSFLNNFLSLFCIKNSVEIIEGDNDKIVIIKKEFFNRDVESGFKTFVLLKNKETNSVISECIKDEFYRDKKLSLPLYENDKTYYNVKSIKILLNPQNKFIFFSMQQNDNNIKISKNIYFSHLSKYSLCGFIVFFSAGHYITFLKLIGDEWYLYDGLRDDKKNVEKEIIKKIKNKGCFFMYQKVKN